MSDLIGEILDDVREQIKEDSELKEAIEQGKKETLSDKSISVLADALHKAADKLDPLAGDAVTDCCQRCTACCCRAFGVLVPLIRGREPGEVEIDWNKMAEREGRSHPETDFTFSQNWVPIVQPWGRYDKIVAHLTRDGSFKGSVWFTCRQLKDGRCQAYEQRPSACRTYLCETAKRRDNPCTPVEGWDRDRCFPDFPGLLRVRVLDKPLVAVYGAEEVKKLTREEDLAAEYLRWGMGLAADGPQTDPVVFEPATPVEVAVDAEQMLEKAIEGLEAADKAPTEGT